MVMPETPDFANIARAICAQFGGDKSAQVALVAEQLRLVWNARGAADIVKLEAELTALMGATASGPYCKNLDRALWALDR